MAKRELPIKGICKSLEIKNFKTFNHLRIDNLNQINIIYGRNNVGKTALLEAIYIGLSNVNPLNVFALLRGFPISQDLREDIFNLLFYNFNYKEEISMSFEFADKVSLKTTIGKPFIARDIVIKAKELEKRISSNSLYIKWELNWSEKESDVLESVIYFQDVPESVQVIGQRSLPPIPATLPVGTLNVEIKPEFYFTTSGKFLPDFHIKTYGDLVKKGLKNQFLEALKTIEESIEDIDVIQMAGVPCIGVKIGKNYFPIDAMGEGFNRIFSIIAKIVEKQNGILLIDEIENGIYWKVQGNFWKYLEEFAKEFNVQIFVTTHSYEFLRNAIDNISNPKIISGIKIKRKEKEFEAVVLSGDELFDMLRENYEVR